MLFEPWRPALLSNGESGFRMSVNGPLASVQKEVTHWWLGGFLFERQNK